MLLDKVEPGPDFSGLISRFSSGASVLVPVAYLQDAQNTLPRVISLAASTGVSPSRARFTAVGDAGPHKVKGPFLAIDVALKDAESEVKIEGGRLYLAGGSDRPLLDVTGLHRPALLEVANVDGETGAIYRTLGREGPVPDRPLALSQGNIAVIGMNGLRAEINTWDPTGQAATGEARPASAKRTRAWTVWMPWLVPIAALAGMATFGWRLYRRTGKGAD
jgi:hypothetical protein